MLKSAINTGVVLAYSHVGPLPLGFHAKVGANLFKGDFHGPSADKKADN
jgi:hypothetical protein